MLELKLELCRVHPLTKVLASITLRIAVMASRMPAFAVLLVHSVMLVRLAPLVGIGETWPRSGATKMGSP